MGEVDGRPSSCLCERDGLMQIHFLHGLESGPHGSKYQALERAFGSSHVNAVDCQGVSDPMIRAHRVAEALTEPSVLVGSSLGGLTALLVNTLKPGMVSGMVLCCPAIRPDYNYDWESLPVVDGNTFILHGLEDEVVPISYSRDFARIKSCFLIEVDDDHRLSKHSHVVVDLANIATGSRFLLNSPSSLKEDTVDAMGDCNRFKA